MNLPKEVWATVMKYSSYAEIVRNCELDETIAALSNQNTFWQDWLNTKYHLKLEDPKVDYRELAAKADRILQMMMKIQCVVTTDCFRYLLEKVSEEMLEQMNSNISSYSRLIALEGLMYNCDDREFDPFEVYTVSVDYEPGKCVNGLNLTDIGKRNYEKAMKLISTDTTYISGDGRVRSIKFNMDIARFMVTSINPDDTPDTENFWNHLSLSFRAIGEYLYRCHFTL